MTEEQVELVLNNERLIYLVLYNKFKGYQRTEMWDDLFSIGKIGLIKASMIYDSSKGTFSTIATTAIEKQLRQHFRSMSYQKRTCDHEIVSLDVEFESKFNECTLHDIIGTESNPIDELYTKQLIDRIYRTSNEKEKEVLDLLYLGYNQFEMAEILHVTRQAIQIRLSRLRTRVKKRMKLEMEY